MIFNIYRLYRLIKDVLFLNLILCFSSQTDILRQQGIRRFTILITDGRVCFLVIFHYCLYFFIYNWLMSYQRNVSPPPHLG